MNELLLIVSLVLVYGGVILAYFFFGIQGLMVFGVFATIVANIEVSLLIEAFGMTQTLGNVLFASTFLITDALSEFRGKREAKQAVKLTLFFSVLFLMSSQLWLHYVPIDLQMGESLQHIFSQTPRVICASLLVFAIASYLDVWLYHWWWKWSVRLCGDQERWLWVRNNGSTLISQFVNTVLFTLGAFWGVYEWDVILQIIISSYAIFVCLAILDTPILYCLVYLAKQKNDYHSQKLFD
ncbi:queuosine precursor transporter [Helicobacter pametensis]|uniref:queuosine precursor transporter n=1 Tax=Helicobacter pametensis TaxID=95149 RepID=UPI0004B229C0|nr:queuosine precursor transporter [Helicobacter pametensis]